ncbi:hypothetical protein MMC08_001890 [Hypocenomyce scalaris]|nr:hypothetical protein [Hypocenomyce scalaris]
MAAVPQKVLNWLYSVLTSEYHDVNRTYSDVAQTLEKYPTFSPRTDVYTHENGQSSLLLHLNGTLPVSFRGTTYMFPVAIWVSHAYPRENPMLYVTPTKGMAVRPGQYVSGDGRIYHPYLASWRDDRSNIVDVLSVLQDVFAREPPVIAREQTRRPPPLQQNNAPPPVPPLPPELGRSDSRASHSNSQPSTQTSPPPPPPKPYDSRNRPQDPQANGAPPVPPHPSESNNQYGPPANEHRNSYQRTPLQMPQYAPQRSSSLRNGSSAVIPPEYQGDRQDRWQETYIPISPISPINQQKGYPPHPGLSFQPQYNRRGLPLPPLPASTQQLNLGYQPHSTAQHQQHQPRAYPPYLTQQATLPNAQQPSKSSPQADLLTSPFDKPLPTTQPTNIPAPPIPPNPEKDALLSAISRTLTQHLHSSIQSNSSSLGPLHAQHAALTTTLHAMQTELSHLNNLSALLTSNENILRKAMRDADVVMGEAKRRKDPPGVDEVLVAPTVVGGQLYELCAEERALEEARGVIGRGLDQGRVGVEVWAKQTRSLAREQFLKKALIKKIAKGVGLLEQSWN